MKTEASNTVIRISPETRERLDRLRRARGGISIVTAATLMSEAWDLLTPQQQDELVRRVGERTVAA